MWELLPHVLRNEHLRERVAQISTSCTATTTSRCSGLAAIPASKHWCAVTRHWLIALLDGLAMQKAVDPERVGLDELFALWADIAAEWIDRRLVEATGGTGLDANDGDAVGNQPVASAGAADG